MTGLTHMHVVQDRHVESRHVNVCELSIRECAVCLSWWEELCEHVREGRIEIPAETEQTELPL
jgi:hypothetical protein